MPFTSVPQHPEEASTTMHDPHSRTRADLGWLVTVGVMVVLTGMAYSLWWAAVVRHNGLYWVVPGDTWGTVRAAHWIDWGSFSFIYNAGTGLVTLPGFHVLLAPFVALSSHLHLSETAPGLPGPPKPTSWFLIGPIFLACATLPVFAADALARRLGTALWACSGSGPRDRSGRVAHGRHLGPPRRRAGARAGHVRLGRGR